MAANMYRVGDNVYFETSSTAPYQIRRVEELCKTASGNVEAKVMCFYRRRDISSSLIALADKHQNGVAECEVDGSLDEAGKEELNEKQRHQLRHRELFLSRQVETLPATHIRGKCNITLLNETESLQSYLNKEDTFFYSLVYDPQQKTLLADKAEIRVGSRYQVEHIPALLKEGEIDCRDLSKLENLSWNPTSALTDQQLDQFLIISRSIGTFSRALDCTSTVRQPSLHMSAAAASRDITLFHAMEVLHKHGYDMTTAIQDLVPRTGPVLCRDEMEEWSASEANLFEEALDKYGKDFGDVQQDFLPWKSLKSIVEYYYMWKTTDRYVQQKRIKAAEAESKLKQVYIPNYNKPNPAQINDKMNGDGAISRSCESCFNSHSSQWYSWGPAQMQCRLCAACWIYWKKYGGLKMPAKLGAQDNVDISSMSERLNQQSSSLKIPKCTVAGCGKDFRSKAHLARHLAAAHGLMLRPGSPCPVMKTRAAFCLVTTPLTRISRQVCKVILNLHRSVRRPFEPIDIGLIKQECQQRLPELMTKLKLLKAKKRLPMDKVSARLGIDIMMEKPPLLQRNDAKKQPIKYAFPQPPAQPVVKSLPAQSTSPNHIVAISKQPVAKKRAYEHANGMDGGPPTKHTSTGVIRQAGSIKQMEPKMRGSTINRMNGRGVKVPVGRSRKHKRSSIDTPDDVFFIATDVTRKVRKQITNAEIKKGARKPWRKLPPVKAAAVAKEAAPVVVLD